MQDKLFEIVKSAQKALDQLENGKLYTSAYVVERFVDAADSNPNDILIHHMRDVLSKRASSQEFFSQVDVAGVYDRMLGLSGGNSSFRSVLGDLLPESRQYAEKKAQASDRRTMSEATPIDETQYINKDLSEAFSQMFGFGKENSFSAFSPQRNNLVNKMVIASLTGLGHAPSSIEMVHENEHFVLCAALYNDGLNKVAINIPVQISGGNVQPPTSIVQNEGTVALSKENLWVAIKEAKDSKKYALTSKYASQRETGSPVSLDTLVVPTSLEKFADFENLLITASATHSPKCVNDGLNLVSSELKLIGAFSPKVKVASTNDREIVFNAHVPTERGVAVIQVPVEIHNGSPILPSKFAASNSDTEQVYDFDQAGYSHFLSDVKGNVGTVKLARQRESMENSSYHQLMDRMLKSIASKEYVDAEEALISIQNRFDVTQWKAAFDKYTQLLKHSSTDQDSERKQVIEAAIKRGDLIKHSTTVEWFCPKLGLPLSKIAFDESGRPIPLRALRRDSANEEAIMISSYDIRFN